MSEIFVGQLADRDVALTQLGKLLFGARELFRRFCDDPFPGGSEKSDFVELIQRLLSGADPLSNKLASNSISDVPDSTPGGVFVYARNWAVSAWHG